MRLNRKTIAIVTICILLAGSAVASAVLVFGNAGIDNEPQSRQMFDTVMVEGWRQGPGNDTSKVLFSNANPDGTSTCFTSIEYYSGMVDIDSALADGELNLAFGGNKVTKIGTQPLDLQTLTSSRPYELHQYQIDSDGSSIMGGHSIGYIKLDGGYIKIYANCNTAEDLASTIPALKSYRLISE